MFWGITPSVNFFEELQPPTNSTNEINILLVGGCDARHILRTSAKKYQYKNVKLNFYVMEALPEVIAKELLLLTIALQPVKHLGLAQKTRTFMEIYGNSLIRPATGKYLTAKARTLIDMITDLDCMKRILPNVDVELKYKERDYIEGLYKFWASSDKFDILDCWDRRLRKSLGVRYDTRNGAFDWDLHMCLHNVHQGAKIISNQEYQSFRRSGVAYAWLETEVTRTNRSMVTGVIANGDQFAHYGYLGDMHTGPFITYGIECQDEDFFKKTNHLYKYRATDVTERNLREIFHEIEFGTSYEHQTTTDLTLGSTIMRISELKVVDTGNIITGKFVGECFNVDGVQVKFLSLSQLPLMQHKERFSKLFDLVYFGHNCVKHMSHDVINYVVKPGGVVMVENQLFIVTNREKELKEHLTAVNGKMADVDCYQCPLDVTKDTYIKYKIN